MSRSMCLWVPFNLVNFTLVPLEYRMLSGGMAALGWNIFLSGRSAAGQQGQSAAELQQAIRASRLTIPMLNSILRVSSL